MVATIVLVWDAAKWQMAGPKLRLTVNSGMKSANIPEYEGKTLIVAHVVNYGDHPTTLTHLAFTPYKNLWSRLLGRGTEAILIMNPNIHQRLPFELTPGTTWDGIAIQTEKFETLSRGGYLMCEVTP